MCLAMCPQQPHRTIWNHEIGKATKCDLCLDTPHWNETGGPGGKQACVESCPVQAIKFVSTAPNQRETKGYEVNLRNDYWLRLGLVDDSRTQPPPAAKTGGAPKAPKTASKE
jgi:protein NrfC